MELSTAVLLQVTAKKVISNFQYTLYMFSELQYAVNRFMPSKILQLNEIYLYLNKMKLMVVVACCSSSFLNDACLWTSPPICGLMICSISWVHTTTFRPTFGHTSSFASKGCLKFIRVDARWRMLTNVVFVEKI